MKPTLKAVRPGGSYAFFTEGDTLWRNDEAKKRIGVFRGSILEESD